MPRNGTVSRLFVLSVSVSVPARKLLAVGVKVTLIKQVAEGASGEPIWEVLARYLRAKKTVPALRLNSPRLIGVGANRDKAA